MSHHPPAQKRLLSAVFATLGDTGKATRVEERIVQGISAGVLMHGDRLPSEVEMAASLGVSTVTAREALVGLRSRGLVETRRGREGGTFIALPSGDRSALVRYRLAQMSRVELRDLAIHYAAIAATAAELAADAADADDAAGLPRLLMVGGKGKRPTGAVGDFLLELAALSQSARLTREFVRLHTEFGPFLGLAHDDAGFDDGTIAVCHRISDAVASANPVAARALVHEYVRTGVAWLIDEHTRLQHIQMPVPPGSEAATMTRGNA